MGTLSLCSSKVRGHVFENAGLSSFALGFLRTPVLRWWAVHVCGGGPSSRVSPHVTRDLFLTVCWRPPSPAAVSAWWQRGGCVALSLSCPCCRAGLRAWRELTGAACGDSLVSAAGAFIWVVLRAYEHRRVVARLASLCCWRSTVSCSPPGRVDAEYSHPPAGSPHPEGHRPLPDVLPHCRPHSEGNTGPGPSA